MRYYVVRHADGSFHIIDDSVNLSEYSVKNHIILNNDGVSVWFSGTQEQCEVFVKNYSWWNECTELNHNDAVDCMKAFIKEFELRLADKQYTDIYKYKIVVPISSIQDILVEMGVRK